MDTSSSCSCSNSPRASAQHKEGEFTMAMDEKEYYEQYKYKSTRIYSKNGSNLVMMSGKIGSCTKQIQRTGRLILWYSYSWKPLASLFSGQSLHWCQQLPANWVFQKSEAVNLGVLLTSELQTHRTWSRVQHGPTPSYDTGSLCTLAWNLASSLSSDHEPPSNVESNVDAISHTFDASIYILNLFLEVYKFRSLKSLNSWRQRSASLKITTQCSCTNSDSSNEPRFAKLWKSFSASANWHFWAVHLCKLVFVCFKSSSWNLPKKMASCHWVVA